MSNPPNPYAHLFANPNGPGDARPTAMQIVKDNDLINFWPDRVCLVTGATSGIGIETARALHATGAHVFITARNPSKAQTVVADILATSEGKGKLDVLEMDMTSLESVKGAAKSFLEKSDKLNVLVNNAGVMAFKEKTLTQAGFEMQFGVNHLAHFLFTTMLLPTLVKSSTPEFNSRVVSLSSNGNRFGSVLLDDVNFDKTPYDPWVAYAQSKTANIWLANYIDRKYGSRGVHANSIMPGGIMTGLQANQQEFLDMWKNDAEFMKYTLSVEQGAASSVLVAVAKDWEGVGGKYVHACEASPPAVDLVSFTDPGYGPHAFNPEGEDRLWELSCELTGVKVEV